MLAFESVKSLLFPTITVWQSHWLTIGFSTIVATAVAVLVMKRMDRLHQHALVALAARQDSQQRTLGTEQALRERQLSSTAQQRFGALVEHSTDVIMIMDPAGQVLFESPATQKVTGFQAAERGQFTALDEVHPDDLPHAQLLLGQVLAVAGATAVTDLRIRHRDGGWRWVDVRATNMIDVPAVAGVIVNYRDITERRQAQDAAVEQAAALRLFGSGGPPPHTPPPRHPDVLAGGCPGPLFYPHSCRARLVWAPVHVVIRYLPRCCQLCCGLNFGPRRRTQSSAARTRGQPPAYFFRPAASTGGRARNPHR
jgi:PAS domain S-box-containing protein